VLNLFPGGVRKQPPKGGASLERGRRLFLWLKDKKKSRKKKGKVGFRAPSIIHRIAPSRRGIRGKKKKDDASLVPEKVQLF